MKTNARILLLGVIAAWLSLLGVARAQTVAWSDNFDDGNGNNRWYADNGVWQIGTPTIGPGAAHSTNYCATTGLTANYPAGANSRLIRIQSFLVPAANEFPRLRFWHWYSFASWGKNDYGVVEVKGTNGTWQAVSPQYAGSGGGWTYTSVDLSAFAGQTVQLAFHMVYQNTGGYTAPGWYIDDVSLLTGTPVFNNPQGWENGIGDWYAETGTWQVGDPNPSFAKAYDGTNCAGTILSGNYPAGANSRLISPPIVVPAANQFPRLRFWHWYSFASWGNNDYGVVEVKGTNGTWQAVSPQYTGNGGGWTYASVDLNGYAGQTVQLAFHMVYQNSGGYTDPGWYIDDVSLLTGAPVFNNPEGWENGIGDWYAETGTWQVGDPDPSFAKAFDGTNCAGTILSGNYPAGANSRLISPPIVVPAANQFPRLRFWHWYSFASWGNNDYGVVEVKGTNGTWQAVSPQYAGNGGGWTYASVDLSGYAGQTVQLAFHMVYQNSGGYTDPGWYIDDVSLLTGAPVFNNPEGWENGIGDWYAETGTWQVGKPTSGPGAAHTGMNCAATILSGNYPAGANSRLISPIFQVPPAASSPNLRFWQWYNFASWGNNDYGVVEVKGTNGLWQEVSLRYTGNSGAWTEPFIDLTSFGGQVVQVAFQMVYQNTGGYTDPGWYVDDIGIYSSGAPYFITPPASQTNAVGSMVMFDVSASGDQPLSYQWRFNSNPITGATNTALTLTNVQLSQSGFYDVVVTNDAGSVTSTPPALLTVIINLTGTNINDPVDTNTSLTINGQDYVVTGSGEGTDGTADIFYFANQSLAGDGEIIARLKTLQGGDPNLAEAGVMIRESLDPGSKQTSLFVTESTNLAFCRRLTADDTAIESGFQTTTLYGTNYVWLRLARMGNTFVAHYSVDGVNWQYMWFSIVDMTNQVYFGLAVTAHHYGEFATAVFDNVSLGSLTPVSGPWSLPTATFFLGGESWSVAEFQRVGGSEFLLGGVVGDYFAIEGATNLLAPASSWAPLETVTNTYGVVPIVDARALTNQVQYYRAQRLGP